MIRLLDVIACFSVGLLVGTELTVSLFVNPVLWCLEERSQVISVQEFAGRLGRSMPYWYSFNLLLLIAEAILHRDRPSQSMLYAAIVLWVLTILLTILFLVPINNRLASRTTEHRLDAFIQQHRVWDTRHRARILAIGCAFVCLLFSIMH